MIAKKIYQSL